MFTEILKIKPKLEGSDLNTMERTLNTRFSRVAKKFSSGLMDAIKGGAIAGLAVALVNKVLNPLQQVRDAIEKALHAGDDLVTNAQQFSTTPANIARLQAFGQATGLDSEGVNTLLGKFQQAVAQQALTPQDKTAVFNYQGRKDIAEAFFDFVQNMQKMTDVQKSLVQQEVFGGKLIGKSSSFLNANFKEISGIFDAIGTPSSYEINQAAKNLNQQNSNRNTYSAAIGLTDLPKKGKLVNDAAINQLNITELKDIQKTNENLKNAANLEQIARTLDKFMADIQQFVLKAAPLLARYLPMILNYLEIAAGSVKDLTKSRVGRGVVKGMQGRIGD